MKKPVISVIIPSYNRANFISKAIESVMQQTYPHWKLFIVDDASTDKTLEVLHPYLSHPRIRLSTLPINKGISHVMNHALTQVDTSYFLQLDSDDWLEQDALLHLAKAIHKDPQAALYYGNVQLWAETAQGSFKKTRVITHRSFSNKYQFLIYMTYMLHPRCYRTAAVRAVNGWETDDPYEGRIMEDRRMCVKLIERFRFNWIDKVLYHRVKHLHQLTSGRTIHIRNELRRKLVNDSLKRWGNRFEPIFGYRNGLLIVKRLSKRGG